MASKTLPFPTAWQSVPDIPHLRQLHIDLEKAVAGVGRAHPLRIRQVRLAPDGVDALGSVRVEVRRLGDL